MVDAVRGTVEGSNPLLYCDAPNRLYAHRYRAHRMTVY